MILKFFKCMLYAAKGDRGKVCPNCKSTETEDYGPYWHCYRCGTEW